MPLRKHLLQIILLAAFLCIGGMATLAQEETNGQVINMFSSLNLRANPSRSAEVLAELPGSTPLQVTGRSSNGQWLAVTTLDGISGWVGQGYVDLTVAFTDLPILDAPATETAPTETTAPPAEQMPTEGTNASVNAGISLNLRQSPSASGTILAELPGGTPIIVTGRSSDRYWLAVTTTNGVSGWVAWGYVDLNVAYSSLPVVDASTAPTDTAPTEAEPAVTEASGGASVQDGITLNLRQSASTSAAILAQLAPGTPLSILGQNATGSWLQVSTTSGVQGWVSARYVNYTADQVPTVNETVPASSGGSAPTVTDGSYANFAKVGDSITFSRDSYDPIGYAPAIFGNLQPVVDLFMGGENSFTRHSMAAGNGWTTATLLNPSYATPGICQAGETPLACELRSSQASVAMILIGTNDLASLSVAQYQANLARIIEITQSMGVVPALGTIPPRPGYPVAEFNAALRNVAAQYGAVVWEFEQPMYALANNGLSPDNIHPSSSDNMMDLVSFGGDIKQGYQLLNMVILQTLDGLWRNGLVG